jgi:hypothetical protein
MGFRLCIVAASATVILSLGIASIGPHRAAWTSPLPTAMDHSRPKGVTQKPSAYRSLTRHPIAFEANVGQADSRAKFISRNPSYNLFLTSSGAVLSFQKRGGKETGPGTGITPSALPTLEFPEETYSVTVGIKLLGSGLKPEISGEGKLPTISNYFIGNDASQWRKRIPNYARVRYRAVFPGVDVVFGSAHGILEYDFTVAPGAAPEAIRLGFQGFDSVRLDSRGNLVLRLGSDQIVQRRPFLFQQNFEGQQVVQGRYTIRGRYEVGFEVGRFDRSRPLYIDPVLSYATYLGGSAYDSSTAIAVEASGNSYITGWTNSTNFPVTTGVFQTNCGGSSGCSSRNSDIFVSKLSSDGSTVVYTTFIGGSNVDVAKGIVVDGLGNAYVVGHTASTDYPTTSGTVQKTFGGAMDAVVTELNANGTALGFSTYLGGSGIDEPTAIARDGLGNIYVTGLTYSTDFPTSSPLQAANGGNQDADAFVTEINAAGSALVYSTYLGGNGYDRANGIAVDVQNNAYVTGITRSANFPMSNPVQSTCASCPTFGDAFLTEIQSGGVGLGYSTYLGGNQEDEGLAVTVDSLGSAYLAGFSCSTNYPVTAGAYHTAVNGFCDAVVTKLRPAGSGLAYSTYFGGGALDFGQGITQMAGNAYITGQTYSTDLPLANSVQSTCGSSGCNNGTAFIAELKADGSAPVFSTYLGGSGTDQGYGIGVDSVGNAYITGDTVSTNLPTSSKSVQSSFGGGRGDAWAAKITLAPAASLSTTSLTFGSQTVNITSSPQAVSLSNSGTAPLLISSITTSGDFAQTNNCGNALAAGSTCSINVTFTPTAGGTRTGTLTVADNATGSPQTVGLTGTGVSSTVTLSSTSLTFPSQVVGTTSTAQTVTLSNIGSSALTISGITVTGANAGDYAQTNNCGSTVAAGGSCTINVTFKPTATGTRTASLSIADSAAGSPQSIGLTGTGTAPVVGLSPASLTFGNQPLNISSAAQAVTLSNAGNAALTISGISVVGTNAGDFAQTNTCGSSVAAGANCTINVTFKPTATGTRTASLSIADNATGSPQTVGLTGTGVLSSPVVNSIAPSTLLMGTTATLTITGSNFAPGASLSFTNGLSSAPSVNSVTVVSTTSIQASVTAPSNGPKRDRFWDVVVTNPDGNSGTLPGGFTIVASGPVVSLSPTSLNFGKRQTGSPSSPQTVTLSNTGNVTLNVATVSITGTNPGDFSQTNNCGSSVSAGNSCAISVTFTPTATGTRTASVTISDSAPDSPQTVSLSGTGENTSTPTVLLSPSSLTFSSQKVGSTSSAQTVTLTNTGTADLTVTGIAASGDFAETDTCPGTIAAGNSCSINVTFTPTAAGARTGAVTITDNAGTGSQTVSLTGTGVSATAVVVESVSPNSLPIGTTGTLTVTGLNFAPGASLSFTNGLSFAPSVNSVTVVSTTSIQASVTTPSNGPKRNRTFDVVVTNPDGSSGTLGGGFTVTYP